MRVRVGLYVGYVIEFSQGIIESSAQEYICTQGPLANTLEDFWRMVWEKNSVVIVMLTKEVENMRVCPSARLCALVCACVRLCALVCACVRLCALVCACVRLCAVLITVKIKCNRYWPDEKGDAIRIGNLIVSVEDEDASDELVYRQFVLQNMDSDEARTISHFQYTAWPDHGLPPSTKAFLDLVELVDEANKTKPGPIIIHCSAGIGRTGTFCTVHSTLEKWRAFLESGVQNVPSINVVQTVLYMREQRPGMVQTKEQYMFCYLAIEEGIAALNERSKQ
jgi:protein tyrosine phosphatase